MKHQNLSIPIEGTVSIPTADVKPDRAQGQSVVTRDHHIIRAWAERHSAEPATGEATRSGPATVNVNDGGVGIRFNFPGVARFRPISWDEWFEHFDRNRLLFVYQEEVADRAYALWQGRGGGHGRDREDWFEAERQLREIAGGPSARYRFVQQDAGANDK
jgi:Protein of unknown function (DUF2934)